VPEPDAPKWLTTVDPDAARRMSSAYDVDPTGVPRDIPVRRASARAIRRAGSVPASPGRFRAVTYVTSAAFRHLCDRGWLGPTPETVDEWWRHAYDWMRWRMLSRLPTATGRYPMWFWPLAGEEWASQIAWSNKRNLILLVDLPVGEVLLSDFGDWHAVLNVWPATPAECHVCGTRFCDAHEPEDLDPDDDDYVAGWEEVTAEHIERFTPGWDEIFDERRHSERWMQLTGEILRAEHVLGAFEVRRDGRELRWMRHPLVRLWRRGRRWWWKRRHPRDVSLS
jgi:hypothetical protein